MAVGDRQQLAFAGGQPRRLGMALTLGTVAIAARIVADFLVSTVITLGRMPTEGGCAALGDGLEDPALRRRGYRAIAGQVRVPILPDDIGHFECRGGSWLDLRRCATGQEVERTGNRGRCLGTHVDIPGGGPHAPMP